MNRSIKIKRNFGKLIRQSIGGLGILEKVEKICIAKNPGVNYIPPMIIVGPPRTGSTLFYQYLTQYYVTSYISNLASVFYKCPVFVTNIFYNRYNSKRSIYNEIGLIDGLFSPSEAAKVFESWFSKEFYRQSELNYLRTSMSILTNKLGGPFVAKNMNNSMRITNILNIFPDALFIHLTRDPIYNAQSILNARKSMYGSTKVWWSTKPLEYDQIINKPAYEQVLYQVKYINKYVLNSLKKNSNYIHIRYEKFCDNPLMHMEMISEWYKQSGVYLEKKKDSAPANLKSFNRIKLPDKDWRNLCLAYQKVYEQNTCW